MSLFPTSSTLKPASFTPSHPTKQSTESIQQQQQQYHHNKNIFQYEHFQQQKQIYYYSNFSLFDNQKDQNTFYQYSIFMEKVSTQLGIEWKIQANKLFCPYATSREVFMNLLEIWLKYHHGGIGKQNYTSGNNSKKTIKFTFNQSCVEEFVDRMKNDIQRKYQNQNDNNSSLNAQNILKSLKIQTVSVKAVCIGFFMTSNQIWQQMFQKSNNFPITTNNLTNSLFNFTSNNTIVNNNSNNSNIFSSQNNNNFIANNPFIQGVTKTIVEKTFKPVMIVSEKISKVFGKKKIKTNQNVKIQEQNNNIKQECNKYNNYSNKNFSNPNPTDSTPSKFQNCFQQFSKTLDIQRQVQRKLSQINLHQFQQYNSNSQKFISTKPFTQNQSPFHNNIMSSVYDYLTNFLKINTPWQVANTFVTNILEMNNLKTQQGTKVKVLKPAEDFYEKLVFVWILLQNEKDEKKKKQIKFQEYLLAVKTKFNQKWQQKYIIPTKYFFQRINKDWSQIKSQAQQKQKHHLHSINQNSPHPQPHITLNNKQILSSLLKRIRNGMKNQWDNKIKLTTKRNWKSEESIGKSSQFYQKETLKRERGCRDY